MNIVPTRHTITTTRAMLRHLQHTEDTTGADTTLTHLHTIHPNQYPALIALLLDHTQGRQLPDHRTPWRPPPPHNDDATRADHDHATRVAHAVATHYAVNPTHLLDPNHTAHGISQARKTTYRILTIHGWTNARIGAVFARDRSGIARATRQITANPRHEATAQRLAHHTLTQAFNQPATPAA